MRCLLSCMDSSKRKKKKMRGGKRMRLINANELEDLFLYGIDDMSVLGDQAQDQRVIDLIRQQQTIKAVPFYEIARAILKVRAINPNFEYIKRQDVIDVLWKLIDVKTEAQEVKEAADEQ